MTNIFQKIINFSLILLVFLLPLFWLPFSFEVYEFNKLYLIFFFVLLSLLAWIAKAIFVDKEIRIKHTSLNVPIILFLLTAIVSTIFSVDPQSSLFGFYGRFSNGLAALLCFSLFYFLIINNVTESEKQESPTRGTKRTESSRKKKQGMLTTDCLLSTFIHSCSLVILMSYFSITGVLQRISTYLPLALQRVVGQSAFTPISRSWEGLAVFLSILTVLLISSILNSSLNLKKNYLKILLIACFGLLMAIDFYSAWVILIVGLSVLVVCALLGGAFRENINRLLLPITLVIIASIFLLFIDTSGGSSPMFVLLKEPLLDQKISWQVGFDAAKDSLKNLFIGSGLGTWHYDFLKQKPVNFNNSILWQIRFDRAGNYFSELLGTLGVLGIIFYILIIGIFFLSSSVLNKKIRDFPYTALFSAATRTPDGAVSTRRHVCRG